MNSSSRNDQKTRQGTSHLVPGLLAAVLLCCLAPGAFGQAESQGDSDSNQEAVATGMKLQWRNGSGTFVDVPVQGLYVKRGTSVTFKTVPIPQGSTFPGGTPTWSGTSG